MLIYAQSLFPNRFWTLIISHSTRAVIPVWYIKTLCFSIPAAQCLI